MATAEPPRPKTVDERVPELKKEVEEISHRGGGMLSSADIRGRIVPPGIRQDEYLRLFQDREWKEIHEKYADYEAGIVIKDFNVLNLTPFSYDLSIGEQFFSMQKPEKGVVTLRRNDPPYSMDAGETVVLLTKELIAIPRYYSATVWPRFGMGGIVKCCG